jgi:ABC-type branched-subunit amino acid transport system ATPase component
LSLLEVDGLTAGYGSLPVVQSVSIRAEAGSITAVIGPNGSGKSTLLKAIIGLLRLSSGRVRLEGKDITGWRPYQIAREGLGYVPQLSGIFPSLTVIENLEMGAVAAAQRNRPTVDHVLADFPDLKAAGTKRAGQLSGGQRNLLGVARALMMAPKAILVDEPTAGLAPANAERVWQQLERISSRGLAVLVVEQNVDAALARSQWSYVMANGGTQLEGPSKEIALPKLDDIFLGGTNSARADVIDNEGTRRSPILEGGSNRNEEREDN